MLDRNYLTRPLASGLLKSEWIISTTFVRPSIQLSASAALNLKAYQVFILLIFREEIILFH